VTPGTLVVIPDLGESILKVRITRWLKAVGDPVADGEPLLELTTDKLDAVLDAPAAGVLRERAVEEGEEVAVGATVGRIE
jgi:2-oxoglutarate dehydrogenase E2 component (dihydrolipoamide succinyltransferase)